MFVAVVVSSISIDVPPVNKSFIISHSSFSWTAAFLSIDDSTSINIVKLIATSSFFVKNISVFTIPAVFNIPLVIVVVTVFELIFPVFSNISLFGFS